MKFRLIPTYNAPVVLTFALLAFLVHAVDVHFGGRIAPYYFAAWPHFDYRSPLSWFRLVSHVLGHKDMMHLVSNFSMILLIGPILEEKYGSKTLLLMIFITALATGILNTLFFNTGLMGASGIVFMMILLGSFVRHAPGEIPLTFILVVALYLTGEVTSAFRHDDISHFAHLLGGLCGTVFGFWKGGNSPGKVARGSKTKAKA
jgi:membrane associated rhomboid family serine protease